MSLILQVSDYKPKEIVLNEKWSQLYYNSSGGGNECVFQKFTEVHPILVGAFHPKIQSSQKSKEKSGDHQSHSSSGNQWGLHQIYPQKNHYKILTCSLLLMLSCKNLHWSVNAYHFVDQTFYLNTILFKSTMICLNAMSTTCKSKKVLFFSC